MKMLVEGESALKVGCWNLADFHAVLRSVLLYAVLDMGTYVHVPSCKAFLCLCSDCSLRWLEFSSQPSV